MRYCRAVLWALVGWYLGLVLGHYLSLRPLWNDEQCVFYNLIQLSPGDFFSRVLYDAQEFPRLYLWAIHEISKPFDYNFFLLRSIPLLAMLGAFFVWMRIARRELGHSWGLVLFVGCWSASMPLVYYAAEIKPYSMDVLVSGLIVLFLLERNLNIIIFLPWLALCSYSAIFLLLLPLYYLVQASIEKRRWLPELSLYLANYILVMVLLYDIDFRFIEHHVMEECWHDYFIAVDSVKHFASTLGKGMNNLIARRFAENPHWVKIPSRFFIGLGLWYMVITFWGRFKKDAFALGSLVSISMAMLLIQLLLAVGQIFPFGVPRMSLFFSPLLFLMTIKALNLLRERSKVLGGILQAIFVGYLVFLSLGIAWDVFLRGNLGAESMLYSLR